MTSHISSLLRFTALFLTILFMQLCITQNAAAADKKDTESVYEKVLKTNTIRCGYGIFEPFIIMDPNTKELSGAIIDIMDEVGQELGFKIDYVEEVDWGQIPQALQSKRIDVMCAGIWGTAKRGKRIGFTNPLFFSTINAFVRADDFRFDNNKQLINSPDVTIATNDSDVTEEIADRFFPKAKRFAKVQLAGESILLMNVVTNKADITFTLSDFAEKYMANNPGTLRQVVLPEPILVYKNVLGVDIHEHELRLMLNSALDQLQNNGLIATILEKYGTTLRLPANAYK